MGFASKFTGLFTIKDPSSGAKANVSTKTNGKEGLEVIASLEAAPSDISGCPVFSSKIRCELTNPDTNINNVSGSYTELYNYSGSGKFLGFSIRLSNVNILVRLEIDGEEIFDVDCDFMESLFDGNNNSGGAFYGALTWNDSRNVLTFNPSCPVSYDTNVTLEAKANNSNNGREINYQLINITKES